MDVVAAALPGAVCLHALERIFSGKSLRMLVAFLIAIHLADPTPFENRAHGRTCNFDAVLTLQNTGNGVAARALYLADFLRFTDDILAGRIR